MSAAPVDLQSGDQARAAVAFHQAECGGYRADLEIWRRIAASCGHPGASVLELGAGCGRVALDLAATERFAVSALEGDRDLAEELKRQAERVGAALELHRTWAPPLPGEARYDIILATMQFCQLLDREALAQLIAEVAMRLSGGGRFAASLVEAEALNGFDADLISPGEQPLPDIRECDGWLFASRPTALRIERGRAELVRLREVVSPGGDRIASTHRTVLHLHRPDLIEALGRQAGLVVAARRRIDPTGDHHGSVVVELVAPGTAR